MDTQFIVDNATPNWLFVGDSIEEGSGLTHSNQSMPRLLAADLSTSILVSCQGGAGITHMPARMMQEIAKIRPRRVHIMIGTNDNSLPQNWKDRMTIIRDYLTGICQQVVVGCVPAEAADNLPETEYKPVHSRPGLANC